MYVHYKNQLIKHLQSMDSFRVIVDFWTESFTGKTNTSIVKHNLFFFLLFYQGLSYCGLALNHIDPGFQTEAFLLGCYPYQMENKRASTIRLFVDGVLNSFGLKLDEEKFFMSDNEPTMKCIFKLNCKRIGCSDHYLNKQLQHVFTSETIDGQSVNCQLAQIIFDDVKQTVSTVRRMHKQQNLSKKLILYSDTRFGGAYNMLFVFF